MLRKLFKKYLPKKDSIKANNNAWLSKYLLKPDIWYLNRKSIFRGFINGFFWMMIPMPFQMVPAIICSYFFRANAPLSILLVWVSNPLTWAPIFGFNYIFGVYILGDSLDSSLLHNFNYDNVIAVLNHVWIPLYLGSAVGGIILGLSSAFLVNFAWKFYLLHKRHKKKMSKK